MKTLTLDIETSPLVVHTWGLWNQNVGLPQIVEDTRVIAVAAKWLGSSKIIWLSEDKMSHAEMIEKAHALVSEADIIVTFNGKNFDMKHLRREFVQAYLPPPEPWVDVDLLPEVKKLYRFPSNKLAYVTDRLGLSGKMSNSGHSLWVRCMAGDPKAWAEMKRYGCQDVRVTEELFIRIRAYIPGLPLASLYGVDGDPTECTCGSTHFQRRGYYYTEQSCYPKFQCQGCFRWLRGTRRDRGVDLRGVK
jgi:hypothetical protein